jgi:hypothetical protein
LTVAWPGATTQAGRRDPVPCPRAHRQSRRPRGGLGVTSTSAPPTREGTRPDEEAPRRPLAAPTGPDRPSVPRLAQARRLRPSRAPTTASPTSMAKNASTTA